MRRTSLGPSVRWDDGDKRAVVFDFEEQKIAINKAEAEGEMLAPQSRRRAGHDGAAEPKQWRSCKRARTKSKTSQRKRDGEAEPDHAFRF